MCLTAQILVIKWNSHKGEQANTSQSPVQATFQLKVRSIPEGTAQYSPQPPTPENHLQPAFYCGKFLSDLFSLFFFFFSAAFFSCKSMLRLSSKATALLEFPAHSSREVFSCRISKTLQSQQNLPQSVAKGSTLITQLGAWERDDIDGKETLCLGKLWERGFMTQKEALGERAGQHNRCN